MTTDTKTQQLIINKLTKAQYEALSNPSGTELYLTPDTTEQDIADAVSAHNTSSSAHSTLFSNKVDKNNNITAATKTKITYDSKGLVTAGADLSASDIPSITLSKISDVTATASEVNVLDGITATTAELNYTDGVTSNIQTQLNSKLNISGIVNNVTTTTTNQALSANMGKELQDQITNLKQRGRYLSIWNSTTGLAQTVPTVNPYTYKAGDYFIVGVVGSTNYRPTGSTYDKDVPSTTVETEDVIVNDTYYYDGTTWSLLHTSQPTVAFSTLAGSPYDNVNLTTALNAKQNTLTAGTGIGISNNTISINQVATEGYNIDITGTLTTLNGVLSGFSSSDYATVPVQLSPSDDSWEAVFKFTTASSKPSRYRYLLGSLQGQNSIVIGQYSTGVLTYWLSSQGGSNWDICSDQRGTIVLSDNTTYTVSVAYDGHSIYTMSISTNDGVSWDMDTSVTSSSGIYGGTLYLGSPYDRSNDTCWQGSIDLNNCRMKIGRQGEIWTGFSTVENIAKATENLYGLVKPDNSTIIVSNGVISASPAIDNSTITINASDQIQAVNLVGLTSTITELNYSDGVTSNIQTQIDNKVTTNSAITAGTATKVTYDSKGLVTSGTSLSTSDIPDISATYQKKLTAGTNITIVEGSTVVPSIYDQLEYIISTSGSYIETNIVPSNHQIDMKVNDISYVNDKHYFGSTSGSTFAHFTTYSNKYFWGLEGTEANGGSWTSGIHTLIFNNISNNEVILDGVTLGQGSYITCHNNLTIGKRDSTANFTGYIYYFKITDRSSQEVVFNGIPARRKSDSVVGLYDTVSLIFFTDAADIGYIAGPTINDGVVINSTCVDDSSTTSTTLGWSANKLNTMIGSIEATLQAIRGV